MSVGWEASAKEGSGSAVAARPKPSATVVDVTKPHGEGFTNVLEGCSVRVGGCGYIAPLRFASRTSDVRTSEILRVDVIIRAYVCFKRYQ